MDVDLAPLFDLVPPQYLVYAAIAVKVFIAVPGIASYLAPLVKRWLGVESPVSKWIDKLAVNTRKAVDSKEFAELKRKLGEHEVARFQQAEALKASRSTIARQADVVVNHEVTIQRQAAMIAATKPVGK